MAENYNKRPLKILCIHGYRQNAQTFKEKTGAFRKIVKKHAELVFITALHQVPPGNMGSSAWAEVDPKEAANSDRDPKLAENTETDPGERGWWFSREDDYFKSVDYSEIAKGFDTTLQQITSLLETEKDGFDGILGFSQGASLVSMLSLIQQREQKAWFKFAILIAGFRSRSSPHDIYYDSDNKAGIPSLHVYGDTDQIISQDMSEELLKYFDNPKVLQHPGGHFVPASSAQKKEYLEFLLEMSKLFF